jgi:hypothetical protein
MAAIRKYAELMMARYTGFIDSILSWCGQLNRQQFMYYSPPLARDASRGTPEASERIVMRLRTTDKSAIIKFLK